MTMKPAQWPDGVWHHRVTYTSHGSKALQKLPLSLTPLSTIPLPSMLHTNRPFFLVFEHMKAASISRSLFLTFVLPAVIYLLLLLLFFKIQLDFHLL